MQNTALNHRLKSLDIGIYAFELFARFALSSAISPHRELAGINLVILREAVDSVKSLYENTASYPSLRFALSDEVSTHREMRSSPRAWGSGVTLPSDVFICGESYILAERELCSWQSEEVNDCPRQSLRIYCRRCSEAARGSCRGRRLRRPENIDFSPLVHPIRQCFHLPRT